MEDPVPPQPGAFIAKLGAWLQLAQAVGLGGTMMGLLKAYDTLSASGAGDPARLSGAIGQVLVFTFAGVSLSLIGIALIIIAITACRYRARWMFQFLCFYGLLIMGLNLWLLVFRNITLVFHLPIGLFFLLFAVRKKGEFVDASRKVIPPSRYPLND